MPSSSTRCSALLAALFLGCAFAGPVEFGRAELNAALQQRGIPPASVPIQTEVSSDVPESFEISGNKIAGGDLRGILYGLLEAADQVRANGRLTPSKSSAAMSIRGVRVFADGATLATAHSREYWDAYLSMLARDRFNRIQLVFSSAPGSSVPFSDWLNVDKFPDLKSKTVSADQQAANFEMLRYISNAATDRGIDFVLGVWQTDNAPRAAAVLGDEAGPYTLEALRKVFATCPAIRGVQFRTSDAPTSMDAAALSFYTGYIFRAVKESGHMVAMEIPGGTLPRALVDAAGTLGVSLRSSLPYWGEWPRDMEGQHATPVPATAIDLLARPRKAQFFWELPRPEKLNIDRVRQITRTLTADDTQGFEIEAPAMSAADTSAKGDADRFDFKRNGILYAAWGRLSYDPDAPVGATANTLPGATAASAPDPPEVKSVAIQHVPVTIAPPKQAVRLSATTAPAFPSLRLHYRALNGSDSWKTVTASGGAFTIPADDISPEYDVLYYFDVPGTVAAIDPDVRSGPAFYVIRTAPALQAKTHSLVPEPSLKKRPVSVRGKKKRRPRTV